jgi:hypothetical protein
LFPEVYFPAAVFEASKFLQEKKTFAKAQGILTKAGVNNHALFQYLVNFLSVEKYNQQRARGAIVGGRFFRFPYGREKVKSDEFPIPVALWDLTLDEEIGDFRTVKRRKENHVLHGSIHPMLFAPIRNIYNDYLVLWNELDRFREFNPNRKGQQTA